MVHAVAGPCVVRALAAQGAECLNINMPDWVAWGIFFQADTGMRQAYLDARKPEKRKDVYALIEDADGFVGHIDIRIQMALDGGVSKRTLAMSITAGSMRPSPDPLP
jgi:crotonobetainyl-CoA:carnitine CoA-transferase CaiB-like acyl-CoA transferase